MDGIETQSIEEMNISQPIENVKDVIYAGSFDPITNGHIDIIRRASLEFDSVVVAICSNIKKTYLLSMAERYLLVHTNCKQFKNVTVKIVDGMLGDYAEKNNLTIIKGIRNETDLSVENEAAKFHYKHNRLQTAFLHTDAGINSIISSSLVKDIVSNYGLVADYVPLNVKRILDKEILNINFAGISGTAASGKSHYSDILNEAENTIVISLDDLAKDIWDRDEPIFQEMRDKVNCGDFPRDATLFDHPDCEKRLSDLNKIYLRPIQIALMEKIRKEVETLRALTYKCLNVVIESVLFEAHDIDNYEYPDKRLINKWLIDLVNNNIILIHTDNSIRAHRLIERGLTTHQAYNLIKYQRDFHPRRSTLRELIRLSGIGRLATKINNNKVSIVDDLSNDFDDLMRNLNRLWCEFKGLIPEDDFYDIINHYIDRPYHNVEHIDNMIRHALKFNESRHKTIILLFSLFHDVIMENNRPEGSELSNEVLSANYFEKFAKKTKIPEKTVKTVSMLIKETENHLIDYEDRKVMLNISERKILSSDLYMFVMNNDKYRKEVSKIKEEYLPTFQGNHGEKSNAFRKARLEFLKKLSKRTDMFLHKQAEYAENNIAIEIKELEGYIDTYL